MLQDMESIPFSGRNLEVIMERLNVKAKDVSEGTGLSREMIYKLVKGQTNPSNTTMRLLGLYMSKVAGRRIKFDSEWDEKVINEYEALKIPDEEYESLKASI